MNRKLVEKADALLAKEKGTVFKDPGGKISFCLVYPNTYHVGMSNLGFQGLYGLLNRREDVVCERAFLPDAADIAEYRRTATPVFSLENKRPLTSFDIVAFSLSFENDYPNIFRILSLSKIPFRTDGRGDYHRLSLQEESLSRSIRSRLHPRSTWYLSERLKRPSENSSNYTRKLETRTMSGERHCSWKECMYRQNTK